MTLSSMIPDIFPIHKARLPYVFGISKTYTAVFQHRPLLLLVPSSLSGSMRALNTLSSERRLGIFGRLR